MIRREELVKIGQFNKPHGLNGEVSFTFTDDVFDRENAEYLVCEMDGIFVPFFIEEYRFRSENGALIKFVDINDSQEAKIFINKDAYISKEYISEEEVLNSGKDFFLNYVIKDKNAGSDRKSVV